MYLLETCSLQIPTFYMSMYYSFLGSVLFNAIYRKSCFCFVSFCLVDNSCFREATSVPDTWLEQVELWVTTMTLLSVIDFRKVSHFQRGKYEAMFSGNQWHSQVFFSSENNSWNDLLSRLCDDSDLIGSLRHSANLINKLKIKQLAGREATAWRVFWKKIETLDNTEFSLWWILTVSSSYIISKGIKLIG